MRHFLLIAALAVSAVLAGCVIKPNKIVIVSSSSGKAECVRDAKKIAELPKDEDGWYDEAGNADIRHKIMDPWGRCYYALVVTRQGVMETYSLHSGGPDGRANTPDDIVATYSRVNTVLTRKGDDPSWDSSKRESR